MDKTVKKTIVQAVEREPFARALKMDPAELEDGYSVVKMILYSYRCSSNNLFPSLLIPEPASTIMISSFLLRISRQVVSPPCLSYLSPETGIDPRAP